MSLQRQFEKAADKISSGCVSNLSQNDQLDLYGLFAVVKKGAAPSRGPSALLDPRGFAKWTAWASQSHLDKNEAMSKYVELVAKHEVGGKDAKKGTSTNSDGFGNKGSTGFDVSVGQEDKLSKASKDICYWATIGDIDSVQNCLDKQGVSPDFRDQDGLTPLMRAVDRNEAHIVDILITAGANIDAVDEEGQTALHYAAYCEHNEMAGLLVSYGASLEKKDNEGMTPIEAATKETVDVMQQAKCGRWQRKTTRYPTHRSCKLQLVPSSFDLQWKILFGVSFVAAAAVILHYRYRR